MVVIFLILFIAMVVEKGVFVSFLDSGNIPNLTLIFVIIISIWSLNTIKKREEYILCYLNLFVSGIFYDLFSLNNLGFSSLFFILVFISILTIGLIMPKNLRFIFLAFCLGFISLMYSIIFYFFKKLVGIDLNVDFSILNILKIGSINLIWGIIFYPILNILLNSLIKKKELELK